MPGSSLKHNITGLARLPRLARKTKQLLQEVLRRWFGDLWFEIWKTEPEQCWPVLTEQCYFKGRCWNTVLLGLQACSLGLLLLKLFIIAMTPGRCPVWFSQFHIYPYVHTSNSVHLWAESAINNKLCNLGGKRNRFICTGTEGPPWGPYCILDLSALAVPWLKIKNSPHRLGAIYCRIFLAKKKKRHLEEAIYYYFHNWLSQQWEKGVVKPEGRPCHFLSVTHWVPGKVRHCCQLLNSVFTNAGNSYCYYSIASAFAAV